MNPIRPIRPERSGPPSRPDAGILRHKQPARNAGHSGGSLLILGGRIIDPQQKLDAVGDVLILDGKVAAVNPRGGLAAPEGVATLDATGLVVTPGFIDLHTHLRDPGLEQKETIATGTRAAAAGGFTTVCCMPNTDPAIDSRATVDLVLARARTEAAVRVLPIGAVTRGRQGRALVEMGELAEAGVVGFSDDGNPVADARIMRSALSYSRPLGLPIIDHCEDPALAGGVMHEGRVSTILGLRGVPAAAEETMVARDILLAELTGGRVHLAHISTAGAAAMVRQAKARGLPVTAEVTPHHLTLTHDWVIRKGDGVPPGFPYDTNTKVNPPLRTAEDVEALIEALADGIIDAIATDHAPHSIVDKLCAYDEAAPGISCIETALGSVLALVHQRRLDLPTLVERLTWAPARIVDHQGLGLGTLRQGAPGDVAVFDPELKWKVDTSRFISKGKNSPLNGQALQGKIVVTIVAGAIAYDCRGAADNGK